VRLFVGILLFAAMAAPAPAATYSWPLTVQLPMSIDMPADVVKQLVGYHVTIGCSYTPSTGSLAGKARPITVSPDIAPMAGGLTNGVKYDGTMTLRLISGGTAPVSGDTISCKFNYRLAQNAPVTFKDSSPSTLTLP